MLFVAYLESLALHTLLGAAPMKLESSRNRGTRVLFRLEVIFSLQRRDIRAFAFPSSWTAQVAASVTSLIVTSSFNNADSGARMSSTND